MLQLPEIIDSDQWMSRQVRIIEHHLLGDNWDLYYTFGDPDHLDRFGRLLAAAEITIFEPQEWREKSRIFSRILLVRACDALEEIGRKYCHDKLGMEIAWKMAAVLRKIGDGSIKLPDIIGLSEGARINQVLDKFPHSSQPGEAEIFAGKWVDLNAMPLAGHKMLQLAHLRYQDGGSLSYITPARDERDVATLLVNKGFLKPYNQVTDIPGIISEYIYSISDQGIELVEWFSMVEA